MKNLKLLMIALMAIIGLSSCEKHECDDHSVELSGTWTCLQAGFAEALVISADGSIVATGVAGTNYWENVKGNITVKDGKATLAFEDNVTIEGHFDIVPGVAFSINQENGERVTFNYCKEDLSDKVIGMWVLNDGVSGMTIQTYQKDGKSIFTGFSPNTNGFMTNMESSYKVVGDLMFQKTGDIHFATRLAYSPNGTLLGDMLSTTATVLVNNEYVTSSYSFLRIKQSLDLTGKVYDYSSAYVTNAKGKDEDFSITGSTFNIANIKAGNFDMMFRSVLFCVDFPNANTIKQHFRTNGINTGFETPITIDGNKVTLDLSAANPAYRKVDMYMFQDANSSQLHIYMPTSSFINYFANLEIVTLLTEGKIDPTDSAAVEQVYTNMEARVESINVSFVMKARK